MLRWTKEAVINTDIVIAGRFNLADGGEKYKNTIWYGFGHASLFTPGWELKLKVDIQNKVKDAQSYIIDIMHGSTRITSFKLTSAHIDTDMPWRKMDYFSLPMDKLNQYAVPCEAKDPAKFREFPSKILFWIGIRRSGYWKDWTKLNGGVFYHEDDPEDKPYAKIKFAIAIGSAGDGRISDLEPVLADSTAAQAALKKSSITSTGYSTEDSKQYKNELDGTEKKISNASSTQYWETSVANGETHATELDDTQVFEMGAGIVTNGVSTKPYGISLSEIDEDIKNMTEDEKSLEIMRLRYPQHGIRSTLHSENKASGVQRDSGKAGL